MSSSLSSTSATTSSLGGRPRKPAEDKALVTTVRLTAVRKAKLQQLGTAWLSAAIDAAPAPTFTNTGVPMTVAESNEQALNAKRYEKLRRWMSSNVPEGWREVENMGALAAWQSWADMDAYLDGLPECNVGLCEMLSADKVAVGESAPAVVEALPATQANRLADIVIGNPDPRLFAIGKKWIDYAQSDCDVNDIAAAIWSAIAEVENTRTTVS